MKKKIAEIEILRKVAFPILRKFNFEYGWKHDVTLRKLYLETWFHKGYWFYGSKRESSELKMFNKIISNGDCVFEIGGHIGYVTQIFEGLVGVDGKVLVAEPTPKNVRPGASALIVAMPAALTAAGRVPETATPVPTLIVSVRSAASARLAKTSDQSICESAIQAWLNPSRSACTT